MPVPASRLDATDRHVERRRSRDHHADVQDAILLGSDELLAGHQEGHQVGLVGDLERRHAPALIDLRHIQRAGRHRLVQRDVAEIRLRLPSKAKDLEAVVLDGLEDLNCP